MTAPIPFFDRLEAVRQERGSILCVGIDPRLERMPLEITEGLDGDVEAILTRFGIELLDLAGPQAACFKPQIAFFEAHGMSGLRAFAAIVAAARERGLLVIGDVKRGDIGSTAAAYAQAFLEPGGDLEVDAITINPYLGADALQPFVDTAAKHGKGLYVLVRTSNPGGADLQELVAGEQRIFEHTAALVRSLGEPHVSATTGLSCVGAVVGATTPEALQALRGQMPDTPFLVPGYGAQGGTAADVVPAFRADGSGAVVNASRSINYPTADAGAWRAAVERAAQAAREDLHGASLPA
ncbi:MAG: orotidine-5'-phosphate decarboxylase [Planctomycetota bacterium]|nr:orotidine-5'-phosphate decarboxylase [Planctomycetota bacterium]